MSAKEDSFVVFDKVQKSYDGLSLVVKDLNLHIKKGEFLTMLGPSGSGKELVARKIHKKSKRNNKPFIILNGALLDLSLIHI